jgi:hypothetical protein
MALNLTSVNAKLRRAEEHAKSIEKEIRDWADGNSYSLSYETNPDYTRYSTVLHIHREPDLERWSLIAADSIHNLRCALDHLVYALAIHESGQDPPPDADDLMFPICDAREGFERNIQRGRLGTISIPMRAVVEMFQPYNRPYPKLPPLLAMLRDFENANKHRLLQLVYAAISNADIGFVGPPIPPGTEARFFSNKGEIKDGAEITAMVFNRPTPNMKYDRANFLLVFALTHKLGPGGVSDRDDVTTLVDIIGREIRTLMDSVIANVRV